MLKTLADEPRTIILYESPHRLVKTLNELCTYMGADRQAAVCRELTKMFEETNKNSLAALAAHYEAKPPKGEIVIVIEGAPPRKHKDKYPQNEEENNEEETEDDE